MKVYELISALERASTNGMEEVYITSPEGDCLCTVDAIEDIFTEDDGTKKPCVTISVNML